MTVKELIGYLEKFSPEKEIEFSEAIDFFDTYLVGIREEYNRVIMRIKISPRSLDDDGPEQ